MDSESKRQDQRGGFVMAVVVFFLFAIGIAGAAGYQLVQLEAVLSTQGKDSEEALSVAAAGLERELWQAWRWVGGFWRWVNR